MSDAPLREPGSARPPRETQPLIVHKPSRNNDRLPTAEQLDELERRPRSEKPALLTRPK